MKECYNSSFWDITTSCNDLCIGWMLMASPSLSLVEQKPQQTNCQPYQQDSQQQPERLAPAWQRCPAVVVIVRLRLYSSVRHRGRKLTTYAHRHFNPILQSGGLWPRKSQSVSSRESAHRVRVPQKQILALSRLQHELWDADARWRVAIEHDGGGHHLGLLTPTLRLRWHHHIQASSWGKSRQVIGFSWNQHIFKIWQLLIS